MNYAKRSTLNNSKRYTLNSKLYTLLSTLLLLLACRNEQPLTPSDRQQVAADSTNQYAMLYVLNEGNFGANKASIDVFDLRNGLYTRNVYAERNPHVVKELGDSGSDIAVYGSRLYAVINGSNKVEVTDLQVHRIGQINVPNPRYVAFQGDKLYISAYASTKDETHGGSVYEVDTATLQITREALVGPQPDELVLCDSVLYCTCSGGYNYPDYDSTLSVVDVSAMVEKCKVKVGLNPIRVRQDRQGRLWVLCSGNYGDVAPQIVVLEQEKVVKTFAVNAANMAIEGDTLYYVGNYPNTFGRIRISSLEPISGSFITDGTDADIATAYGLLVHPQTHIVYLTDVKNYVSSGTLYGYSPAGKRVLEIVTGDVPGHLVLK